MGVSYGDHELLGLWGFRPFLAANNLKIYYLSLILKSLESPVKELVCMAHYPKMMPLLVLDHTVQDRDIVSEDQAVTYHPVTYSKTMPVSCTGLHEMDFTGKPKLLFLDL